MTSLTVCSEALNIIKIKEDKLFLLNQRKKGQLATDTTTEHGVKLISEYNNLLTKNEEEKQYILQINEDYRRLYPSVNKYILTQNKYLKNTYNLIIG